MHNEKDDLTEKLAAMKPKTKEPNSLNVLNSWIAKAENEIDSSHSGRIAWLIATTICAAKLQSVLDANGDSRFALKGGTLLQHRLGLAARATKDLDGMIRGDLDDFLDAFDSTLDADWGPISFQRSDVEIINTPAKFVKPRRFDLSMLIRGKPWRRVQIEISPSEGRATESFDSFPAPKLEAFGIPSPDHLVGIALSYQIAQKFHAATDPHDPPTHVNRRARDVVDLILLKDLVDSAGEPADDEIRAAIVDIFDSRAKEALLVGRQGRALPARLVAYPHWQADFEEAARNCGVDLSLEEAVDLTNEWLDQILASESKNQTT